MARLAGNSMHLGSVTTAILLSNWINAQDYNTYANIPMNKQGNIN